jgi:hypothetical protein
MLYILLLVTLFRKLVATFRKLATHIILKVFMKAAYEMYTLTDILIWLLEQSWGRVTVFKEARKNLLILFYF